MAVATAKVPAIVASSVICFALGAGAGVLAMWGLGYHWDKQQNGPTGPTTQEMMGMGGMGGGMRERMGGMGGMGGRGGMGPPAPGPTVQLAALVTKLDDVTAKPLAVQLGDKQKKAVAKELAGLSDEEELSDKDAQKRFDAIVKALTDEQKETLRKAGWMAGGGGGRPGGGGGRGGPPGGNPFKEDPNKRHLKSLEKYLGASGES